MLCVIQRVWYFRSLKGLLTVNEMSVLILMFAWKHVCRLFHSDPKTMFANVKNRAFHEVRIILQAHLEVCLLILLRYFYFCLSILQTQSYRTVGSGSLQIGPVTCDLECTTWTLQVMVTLWQLAKLVIYVHLEGDF